MSNSRSRDALKSIDDLFNNTHLHDARVNMSQTLKGIQNSKTLQNLRMQTMMLKMGAMGAGKDIIDSSTGHGIYDNIMQAGAYGSLVGFPQSGGVVTAALLDAQKRAVAAKQGSNGNGVVNNYDTAAAAANAMKNFGNTGKNLFYASTAGAGLASAMGNKHHGFLSEDNLQTISDISRNSFMMGPMGGGLLASKMLGGTEALGGLTGGAMSKLLATAGVHGVTINPMLAGVATMMALSKGTAALHKMVNDKSSINQAKNNRSVIFHSKHPHQLEDEYGATMFYRNLIAKMQSTGQMDTQTAILGQLLAAIEGHTSVLPLLTAEFVNKDKRSEKQTNKALNHLSNVFGDDGTLRRGDQSLRNDPGIFFKMFSGFEKFSSQFQSTFDIMGQVSNTLNGKSSTALSNEARSLGETGDLLEAQKRYGRKYGISTGMVQAIHTTPSEVMDKADTYEGRVLSILGLISEINRFSAHELLQIRTQGFGLNIAGSSSYLAKAQTEVEDERRREEGINETYEKWFKGIDEKLGYIPGYNVLSGTLKMSNDLLKTWNKFSSDDPNQHKTMSEYFTNWILKGHENTNLGSAESLRNAAGANEMSAEQRMSTYLGYDYPNKVEEMLDYLHSIDESTAVMAGNIDRTHREQQTMNNFTGLMGNQDYHDNVNGEILSRIENEFNTLDSSNATLLQSFFGYDQDALRAEQRNKFMRNNVNFMNELSNSMEIDGGNKTFDRSTSHSVQDVQDEQDAQVARERQLSTSEKQLMTLFEIRDILSEQANPQRGSRRNQPRGLNDRYESMIQGLDIDIDFDKRRQSRTRRLNSGASRSTRLASLLGDFVSTQGTAAGRRAAAGRLARALTIGGGRGALALIGGPIGMTLAAGLATYALYEGFVQNDFEDDVKSKGEENADKAEEKFGDMNKEQKSAIMSTINKINRFDDDYDKLRAEIKKVLEPKSTDELYLMIAALKDKRSKDPGEKYILARLEEMVEKREKTKALQNMSQQDLDKYTTEKTGGFFNKMNIFGTSHYADENNKDLRKTLETNVNDDYSLDDFIKNARKFANLSDNDIIGISSGNNDGFVKNKYMKGFANYIANTNQNNPEAIKNLTDDQLKAIFQNIQTRNKATVLSVDDKDSSSKKEEIKYDAKISQRAKFNLDNDAGKELVSNFAEEFKKALSTTGANETVGITASEMQKLQVIIDAITKKSGTNEFQTQFNDMLHILASQHATTAEALTAVTKLASRSTGSTDMQKKIATAVTNN